MSRSSSLEASQLPIEGVIVCARENEILLRKTTWEDGFRWNDEKKEERRKKIKKERKKNSSIQKFAVPTFLRFFL